MNAVDLWLRDAADFLFVREQPVPADAIFIPGGTDIEHVLYAAELYLRGLAPLIVPSGRFAKGKAAFQLTRAELLSAYPDAYATEADWMRAVLLEQGVPDAAILPEKNAVHTWDNALQTRALLRTCPAPIRSALLCCKPWHARRALTYYQLAMPSLHLIPCPCAWPGMDRSDWFTTPQGRAAVLDELTRCGHQLGDTIFAEGGFPHEPT